MKLRLLAFLCAPAILLSGCASLSSSNDEDLMIASGFQPRVPTTARQKQVYASMPDYKIQSMRVGRDLVYVYKDPKKGMVYVGGPAQYQKYRQLALQQDLTEDQLAAAELNASMAVSYGVWGPWGPW